MGKKLVALPTGTSLRSQVEADGKEVKAVHSRSQGKSTFDPSLKVAEHISNENLMHDLILELSLGREKRSRGQVVERLLAQRNSKTFGQLFVSRIVALLHETDPFGSRAVQVRKHSEAHGHNSVGYVFLVDY